MDHLLPPTPHHLQQLFVCICMEDGVEWERGRIHKIFRERELSKQFIPRVTTLNNCRGHYSCILCTALLLLAEVRGQLITLGILPVFLTQCPYPIVDLFFTLTVFTLSLGQQFSTGCSFAPASRDYLAMSTNISVVITWRSIQQVEGSGILPNVVHCIGQHPPQRMIPHQISIVLRQRNSVQRSPSVFPPFPSIIQSIVAYSL